MEQLTAEMMDMFCVNGFVVTLVIRTESMREKHNQIQRYVRLASGIVLETWSHVLRAGMERGV
eukprot:3234084-Amphidinium_carterae.2